VSEFTLTALSPLGGARHDFEGVTISEVTGRAIVSVATPMGGDNALSKAVSSAFKTTLPLIGSSTTSAVANSRLLGMQQGLFFLLFDHAGPGAVNAVAERLKGRALLTDQSDSWVMIEVSGANARAAFERICPIDLHPAAFPAGKVARTSMEHLSAIIIREETDTFLVMSPRSSAKSFLHALETSARNVI